MTNIATISFHDQSIIAIEHEGKHFVALRPIVENIGLDWAAQYTRINRHHVLKSTVAVMTTVAEDGKQREMLCLPLSMLNGWLFGVDVNRVREEIRPKLIRYQTECFDVLYQHFMPKAPQPAPYTVQPGDTLNEAQQIALRALMESNVKRLPMEKRGEAMRQGWSKLKAHFKVPYRQIPASEFTEALSIIARHVSQWEVLDAPQQTPPAKAPTMFGRQWLVSTDMNGKETVRPVAPDQFVKSFREIARGIAVGDMELSTAELIDLASACNQRLVHRLGNPALVLAV